jgi:hyperosmotically inducible protein
MRERRWWKAVAVGVMLAGTATGGIARAATMSDAWITAKTKTALLTSENVPATSINVDTMDGTVTLHGKVNSAEQKARAEQEARKVSGVKNVRNLLQVVPEAQKEAVKSSDSEIQKRVESALQSDPGLKNSDVDVQSVNDGVVLLKGKAATVSDHLRALEITRSVPGVRQVKTEVTSPDKLADAEIQRERDQPEAGTRGVGQAAKDMYITSATKMRLMADEKTPATDINVDTRDGVVTLFGIVNSEEAKRAAEADARQVSGVRTVRNELEVVPKAKQERVEARDDDLQKEVAQRLKQRDDLSGVEVEVKNGVARLTGKVANDDQRLTAAVTARSTPGIRAIHDELKVETAKSNY